MSLVYIAAGAGLLYGAYRYGKSKAETTIVRPTQIKIQPPVFEEGDPTVIAQYDDGTVHHYNCKEKGTLEFIIEE